MVAVKEMLAATDDCASNQLSPPGSWVCQAYLENSDLIHYTLLIRAIMLSGPMFLFSLTLWKFQHWFARSFLVYFRLPSHFFMIRLASANKSNVCFAVQYLQLTFSSATISITLRASFILWFLSSVSQLWLSRHYFSRCALA